MEKNSIALLPLDNRPISYLLPKQIAEFSGIDLMLPERQFLGNLNHGSDLNYIEKWLTDLKKNSTLIISLDNWIYGGLVQSRKHSTSFDELKSKVLFIKELKDINKYGFSSVMRISNNNDASEEKEYWENYGEKIFKWSELTHKVGIGIKEEGVSHKELLERWYQSSKLIPPDILSDYKGHRDKNFTINLQWLESLHKDTLKYLILSCDDASLYGMNVVEAEYLKQEIKKHNFTKLAKVISGTDEIPLVLLTKAILESSKIKPSVSICFDSNEGAKQIAKYESSSIQTSVFNQLEVLGLEIKEPNNEDIALFIHIADSYQGDHVFNEKAGATENNVFKLIQALKSTDKPFILIDLAYANGADPVLIEPLLKAKITWNKCYGYAAWNTCSNSIGCAMAIGINRWIAEKRKIFNENAFKRCLLTRFLDDYAYQSQIRHSNITELEVNKKLGVYVQTFSTLLDISNIKVNCKLPWKRSFEVEVEFYDK